MTPEPSAAQDRWPDGSADECPKCGFLHAYDRSCEDRASSAASTLSHRLVCAGVMLCAVSIHLMWGGETVAWFFGVVFGVALVGFLWP